MPRGCTSAAVQSVRLEAAAKGVGGLFNFTKNIDVLPRLFLAGLLVGYVSFRRSFFRCLPCHSLVGHYSIVCY